ncbi:MAG: hypothetical protein AMJ53_15325 [Gammaproteobacteria bacterium SG8_11]|nr:MAG: hypothetical protein AMJ53_15325 [Gammaproteobacteria bacterium SG8_11]
MRPIELALNYMASFFGEAPLDSMESLLAKDLVFKGPFHEFNSAQSYLESIKVDPPQEVSYRLVEQYATRHSACLVYEFIKPGIKTLMAQTFRVKNGKITAITLIFDSKAF